MDLERTFLLLVTCSLDETRRDLAVSVTKNIAGLARSIALAGRFVLFDNASKFTDHLAHAPAGTLLCAANRNIGYWTAIKWVLENRENLRLADCEYLYIIESDLWHYDLSGLSLSEQFLDRTPHAVGVRTQEFSVRWRWRYNKGLRFVPFRKQRSVVQLINQVTGEKAQFTKSAVERVYLSNLHTKLPALNRISDLSAAFSELSKMEFFSEIDFFKLMRDRKPYVGVLDGGLWYQLSTPQTHNTVSGSWSDQSTLKSLGYRGTRRASIDRETFDVQMSRIGSDRKPPQDLF